MKALLPLILILAGTCSGNKKEQTESAVPAESTATASTRPHRFSEPWDKTFHLRETENGEILSIGAVCSDDNYVFVNDLAAGTVVRLDSTLKVMETVTLELIGRNTYTGDDFTVTDTSFIFLNSIDRRLEFFNRTTGKHTGAVSIPRDLLSDVKKRSQRVLSRIFMDQGRLFIGNEHVLVNFDASLGKRLQDKKALFAGDHKRFSLYREKSPLIADSAGISGLKKGSSRPIPGTHYPVTGKRIFRAGGKVFTITAGKDSVALQELP